MEETYVLLIILVVGGINECYAKREIMKSCSSCNSRTLNPTAFKFIWHKIHRHFVFHDTSYSTYIILVFV